MNTAVKNITNITTGSSSTSTSLNWYHIKKPETTWLVDGLVTSDGNIAVCGKPKAGKSSLVRYLVACVIKGQRFLDRSIDIPAGTGRVLYIHLDRKDRAWRVAEEFKRHGITEDEATRLVLRTEEDIPSDEDDKRKQKMEWLKREVVRAKPHLLVIDLLWQFLDAPNANAYVEVLTGINQLQDALREADFNGVTLVTIHGRKASNESNPADDILGSTAQSGSFATTIMLKRNRTDNVYTIMSDQTDRDDLHGEIDERLIIRNADSSYSLGPRVEELKGQEAQSKREGDLVRLLGFIHSNEDCSMADILHGLKMSEKSVRNLMEKDNGILIKRKGEGKKSDPYKYFMDALGEKHETTGTLR